LTLVAQREQNLEPSAADAAEWSGETKNAIRSLAAAAPARFAPMVDAERRS